MANKAVAKVRAEVLKADVPQQLSSEEAYSSNGWLEPPLPLEGLKVLVNNSTILPQCINAYKTNVAGYGIGVKYRDGDQEETSETKAEWDALQDILNLFTIDMDTKELFEQVVEARETFGIAYLEVIRNREGKVVQLDFLEDVPSVRMSCRLFPGDAQFWYKGKTIIRKKVFRKYKQEVNGKSVYFREFGDMRVMDRETGEFVKGTTLDKQANELLAFPIGPAPYGTVRWIGQILGCDGARRAEFLNNNYFRNGRHMPLAIIVKNGTLTNSSMTKLQMYLNGIRGEAGQHRFLLIEAEGTESDFDANKNVDIELKPLADILQKDELFQDYIENNRKRVQSAFNLPDLYVGYSQEYNRATAQAAIEVTEKQVFQPLRKSLAWPISNLLLNEYELKYCEVEFLSPDVTNIEDLYKLLVIAEKAGGLTPNKAKQIAYDAIGEKSDDYEGDWGDTPLSVYQMQANQRMADAQMRNAGAVDQRPQEGSESEGYDDTDEQLDKQIKKALESHEDAEIVSVMKAVRELLEEMKGGDAD